MLRHPDFRSEAVDTGFVDRHIDALTERPVEAGVGASVALEWARRSAAESVADVSGPWARIDGFEPGGLGRTSRLDLRTEGDRTPAELRWGAEGPWVATIGGALPSGERRGDVVWSEEGAFLLHGGVQTRLEFADHLSRSLAEEAGAGAVVAPMHGRIAALAVAPGDRVTKGDLLFVLEAMKMEHSVLAKAEGTVAAVHISPGCQVAQGAVVVELAPPGP